MRPMCGLMTATKNPRYFIEKGRKWAFSFRMETGEKSGSYSVLGPSIYSIYSMFFNSSLLNSSQCTYVLTKRYQKAVSNSPVGWRAQNRAHVRSR